MIKIIDIYLLKKFFAALLVTAVAVGFTIIIINIIDQLRYFVDNDVPFMIILEYYFYFAGWVLKQFLPMFVLLATLFSVSLLARRNEFLAMKSLGLSLYRLALPLVIAALLLAIGHIYYNEVLYANANKRRVEIKEYTIKKRASRTQTHIKNIYRQISPGHFYTIGTFNVKRRQGENLNVYQKKNNKLASLISAKRIIFEDHYWVAVDGYVRLFEDTANESYYEFDKMRLPEIQDKPENFARRLGKPEDMSYAELKDYIDIMKRTGGPYLRESIDLKIKIAYPLTSVMVVLLSIPFAANPKRGGIAFSFAIGALISLTYFVLFRVLQSAGYNEKIPEDLAVWGINILFFVIGVSTMIGARK